MNKRSDRAPMKRAEAVGDLLRQVLGDQGLNDRLSNYQAWLIWDQLVGEQIARRARPLRIRQTVLEVQVDHPVWMQQLQMMKPQILEKLKREIPNAGITDIYLRKAKTPSARLQTKEPADKAPKWKEIKLSAAELQQIEEDLTEIKDDGLRAEMKRLFCLQLQLNKGRED